MSTAIEKKTKSRVAIPIPKHWEKADTTYTSGDLAKAFLKGYETGRDDQDKILKEAFVQNISKAAKLSEDLFHDLRKSKTKVSEVHLKIEGIGQFRALFVTSLKDYVSDSFKSVYKKALALKHKSITDTFYITFSFMPASDKLNEECLVADGFVIKYEKKQ